MSIILTDTLKLDFDTKYVQKRMSINRIKYVVKMMRLKIKDVVAYRTANGIHVEITLKQFVHPITAVLIQALMNSDYAREVYNAIRAYNLTIHPEDYSQTAHEGWNVLYEEKYVDGKMVSKEEFDKKLTRKLRRELNVGY